MFLRLRRTFGPSRCASDGERALGHDTVQTTLELDGHATQTMRSECGGAIRSAP
jgi:hypothetical protein